MPTLWSTGFAVSADTTKYWLCSKCCHCMKYWLCSKCRHYEVLAFAISADTVWSIGFAISADTVWSTGLAISADTVWSTGFAISADTMKYWLCSKCWHQRSRHCIKCLYFRKCLRRSWTLTQGRPAASATTGRSSSLTYLRSPSYHTAQVSRSRHRLAGHGSG